jgi:hypothetical protein
MSHLRYLLGIICVLAVLGGIVVPARADDDHPIDVRVKVCMDADPSTHGTVGCLREAEKAWDQELNGVY